MNNTLLKELVSQTGLTQKSFAKKVEVDIDTFRAQLRKKNTLDLTYKYATILGVKSIKGYESGVYVELVIG